MLFRLLLHGDRRVNVGDIGLDVLFAVVPECEEYGAKKDT